MVTVYPKSGEKVIVSDAVAVEYGKVPGFMIPRLVCKDANGKEVASFILADICGHRIGSGA